MIVTDVCVKGEKKRHHHHHHKPAPAQNRNGGEYRDSHLVASNARRHY